MENNNIHYGKLEKIVPRRRVCVSLKCTINLIHISEAKSLFGDLRQLGKGSVGNDVRGERHKIQEDLVTIRHCTAQVVIPTGATSSSLHANHPLYHHDMTETPRHQVLVDLGQEIQDAVGQLKNRLFAVGVDKQSGLACSIGQTAIATTNQLIVLVLIEHVRKELLCL